VDSVVSAMETIIQLYIVEGRIPGRIGNRYEFIAPYDSFATADGWVVIGVGGEEVWKRFCKAIEREDLLKDPRFGTNRDRVREYAPLKEIVTEWTSKRNARDIISLLMSFSVPCAPIYNIEQIVNDPHIAEARGMIVDMDHPLEGTMKVVACPIKFTEMQPSIRSTAPLHGEHTELVLMGLLGLSKEEVARLRKEGAVG